MVSTLLRSGLTSLLLAGGIAGQIPAEPTASQAPGEPDFLVPVEALHPTGYPRILVLDAPGSALVTFRLSVPMDPGVDAATAGPVLQALARERIEGAARTLGARIELGSSASALSVTVTGALADLDHLAFLLRQATAAPRESEGFAAARSALEARLTRVGETGEGRVESELRALATPGEASVAEVRERARRLVFTDVEAVWQATHRPERMTLVVVGDVAMPVLLASLWGLASAPSPDPRAAPLSPSPPVRDRPDLLRRWVGFAWPSVPVFDPRAVVSASLAARHLREGRDGYEAYVRLWEGRSQDVLAVVGSAYGNRATALRRRLAGLPGELAGAVDDSEVRDVVRRLHFNLLAQARTPWGRANLVGRLLENGAPPDAARRYVDGLLALTADDVRGYLQGLAASTPVTIEEGR